VFKDVDGTLRGKKPAFKSFSVLTPSAVTLRDPQHLDIEADSMYVAYATADSHLHPLPGRRRVVVHVASQVPLASLSSAAELSNLLFFHTIEDALSAIPSSLAEQVPPTLDSRTKHFLMKNGLERSKDSPVDTVERDVVSLGSGMTPPKLIRNSLPGQKTFPLL
jgi:hypothetical protein